MPSPYACEAEVADWYYQHFGYWYAVAYTARRRRHGWPFHNRIPF